MLCNNCKGKPIARGMKTVRCMHCNKESFVNYAYNSNLCNDCSDELNICICCGERKANKFKVITLCGSTRFKDDFIQAQEQLTLDGYIVISVGLFGHADKKFDNVITIEVKEMFDEMHKRKIDMADEIYVINRDGYIGNSTRSEIEYASKIGKKIRYMFN